MVQGPDQTDTRYDTISPRFREALYLIYYFPPLPFCIPRKAEEMGFDVTEPGVLEKLEAEGKLGTRSSNSNSRKAEEAGFDITDSRVLEKLEAEG